MAFSFFNLFLPGRIPLIIEFARVSASFVATRKWPGRFSRVPRIPEVCCRDVGEVVSEKVVQKTKKRAPKVRSYVRPTRVHTPKPKKKPKYPLREIEEALGDAG
jgi:hypothetical protein